MTRWYHGPALLLGAVFGALGLIFATYASWFVWASNWVLRVFVPHLARKEKTDGKQRP